ncbi:MAG: hypothetical protein ABIV21_06820 [Pyrinomonadaceae bacterium]
MKGFYRRDSETRSFRSRYGRLRVQTSLRFILIFVTASAGCSLPNLEQPQCTAARDTVKRFYSFHFGNDMHLTPENIRQRESFLTQELTNALEASPESATDYFTATDQYPKAFRVGSCTSVSDDKATLQILLLWKDDTKSDQKEVHVDAVRDGDKWLISKVTG